MEIAVLGNTGIFVLDPKRNVGGYCLLLRIIYLQLQNNSWKLHFRELSCSPLLLSATPSLSFYTKSAVSSNSGLLKRDVILIPCGQLVGNFHFA